MKKGSKSKPGKVPKMIAQAEVSESAVTYLENHPSRLRRGAVTLSAIREQARVLQEIALQMQGLASKMEQKSVQTLTEVDGVTKIDRGLKLCAEYVANLGRSVTDEIY